ncbi:xanthine dehydrogenase small subunit [Marinibactrum halimedae]|uniref:Xanthine dehydrogenase n=1 Tax=Marinibactrum halimedae TaxID=1444977 RepID=A0AA37T2J2_9GAMM|nr:xanthine dehydrogenase small subunit [Marinibactrum halimedae]MCD9459668.1 xanthine dehydrogenase small subunit [Marinibactrum halimedae]GLS25694.1 xanthine dehydrogenase [Marinibactrum halimedae]
MIRFNLNGEWREIDEIEPSMTILRYLRTKEGQMGTKEGCASGDCGACTVVLAEQTESGTWIHRTVNSCITLLASAHGKVLYTSEGLHVGDQLHPVQEAMVKHHGSQCGFCTPGIVMSLTAAYENRGGQPLSEPQVLDALSGNLCRCTGYRPIVDAALSAHQLCSESTTLSFLPEGIEPPVSDALLSTQSQVCLYPRTEARLKEALEQYPDARFVAGGTDLLLEKTQQNRDLPQLIGLSSVAELKHAKVTAELVEIGSAVTYSDAEKLLEDVVPSFVSLMHRIGSRQIRNQGTIGGNIANASPIGDTPPVLLALDAELNLASAASERQVSLNEFYFDYKKTVLQSGEYIRSIQFSPPEADEFFTTYKVSKRFEDDISAVLGVIRWRVKEGVFTNVRIAYGGMAAVPLRITEAEAAMEGKKADMTTIEEAMLAVEHALSPMSDVRASSFYRMQVAKNLLSKAWLEASEPRHRVGVWNPAGERHVEQRYPKVDQQGTSLDVGGEV